MRSHRSLDNHSTLHLNGLLGSSAALVLACLENSQKNTRVILLNDREEAAYFFNDLSNLLGNQYVYYFPSSYKRSIRMQQLDKDNVMLRTEVLKRMASRNRKALVVTYPEALLEKVVSRKELRDYTLHLKKGEEVSLDFVIEVLEEYEFERHDFVYEPGQFSVRGGIVDVFSFSADKPYRIDFIGDQVESIRSFEVETQLSIRKHASISIVPNLNDRLGIETAQTLFDFIPEGSEFWSLNLEFCLNRIDQILKGIDVKASIDIGSLSEAVAEDEEVLDPATFRAKLVDSEKIQKHLEQIRVVEFGNKHLFPSQKSLFFNTSLQPQINKNFDFLKEKLSQNNNDLYRNFLLSDNPKQLDRLEVILNPEIEEGQEEGQSLFDRLLLELHEGFYDHDLRIACFTDHQLFDRYHKFKLRKSFSKKEALSIKELTGLHPGDYIVHVDHGIGQFGGLEKVEINGRWQEAIKLVYRDMDTLFVSIHSLHRISKYKGKEGVNPKMYKLGSGAWQKLKQKTKNKIKDIAADLIALYAKRKSEDGFAFSPDTYLQHELEASFIYEDTPDQLKATRSVKEDLESKNPMDRLVCGDVGFGKTEVAIRAAFKAASDSRQVAILVPTTILALQHYKTFSDRLKKFPVNIDYISRLRSHKDQTRVLKDLETGKLDILIGTHKLISARVKFQDLGLLIIDEEQKFGVTMKEKLRQIKANVDTLTLSATPIPRTLQFSMMGARDLSIMNTPPANRHPIITELHTLNEELIKEAIEYELDRGGQVFIIHNRVQNIAEVESLVNRVVKKARTIVAHGQMDGKQLEDSMLGFINGDQDVLIATSIIENGLDIPNANTIIINNAHHFGLSDLHQLRGRVGRSNKKAFCYLIAPPLHLQTPESRRRLKAIAEHSELGSGFNIALQDLDIRGAGNILGAEQSGFIADIGFETYQKILNEALAEIGESQSMNQESRESGAGEQEKEVHQAKEKIVTEKPKDLSLADSEVSYVSDVTIDSDLALLFPESYIESTTERIRLYRVLDEIPDEGGLQKFTYDLSDRFGSIPYPTAELLDMVRLRWIAMDLGIEKIRMKSQKLVVFFISDQDSPFYQSNAFTKVLQHVQAHQRECQMVEKNGKLTLSFGRISTVKLALDKLSGILDPANKP